jgi:dipeptidyl aminopeptidase/acylaminoacyl peptidase
VPEVDPRRVGLVGSSTHGFVALEAAVDPRITAVAAVAACGDYHGFLHRSSLAMNGAPLDLDPTYAAWLRDQEPVTRAGELTHAAILLINGADDAAVPASCARATADVLRRAYERAHAAERFRFLLVPGAGHNDLGPLAREQMLAWLLRWLAAAGGVTSDRGSDAHRRPRAAGRAARPPGR